MDTYLLICAALQYFVSKLSVRSLLLWFSLRNNFFIISCSMMNQWSKMKMMMKMRMMRTTKMKMMLMVIVNLWSWIFFLLKVINFFFFKKIKFYIASSLLKSIILFELNWTDLFDISEWRQNKMLMIVIFYFVLDSEHSHYLLLFSLKPLSLKCSSKQLYSSLLKRHMRGMYTLQFTRLGCFILFFLE